MRIQTRHVGQGVVVELIGDVDMSNSPRLRDTLLGLLRDSTGVRIIVNMEQVNYIDSSGIASLVEGVQAARRFKSRLCLAGLNEGPRHVLQLTRLLDIFEVHPSEADALSA
ncbi:MAG: STAS domain-containing protein [Bryobacterales bacterium]|nr:STAS domain-containing protein [Bryobacterales bacterium]MDE0627922.1 STAS domain-containing protein [Bryobacterales bacterium]